MMIIYTTPNGPKHQCAWDDSRFLRQTFLEVLIPAFPKDKGLQALKAELKKGKPSK
jgi:hypothetical protein